MPSVFASHVGLTQVPKPPKNIWHDSWIPIGSDAVVASFCAQRCFGAWQLHQKSTKEKVRLGNPPHTKWPKFRFMMFLIFRQTGINMASLKYEGIILLKRPWYSRIGLLSIGDLDTKVYFDKNNCDLVFSANWMETWKAKKNTIFHALLCIPKKNSSYKWVAAAFGAGSFHKRHHYLPE